jgi:hypothetical protein
MPAVKEPAPETTQPVGNLEHVFIADYSRMINVVSMTTIARVWEMRSGRRCYPVFH